MWGVPILRMRVGPLVGRAVKAVVQVGNGLGLVIIIVSNILDSKRDLLTRFPNARRPASLNLLLIGPVRGSSALRFAPRLGRRSQHFEKFSVPKNISQQPLRDQDEPRQQHPHKPDDLAVFLDAEFEECLVVTSVWVRILLDVRRDTIQIIKRHAHQNNFMNPERVASAKARNQPNPISPEGLVVEDLRLLLRELFDDLVEVLISVEVLVSEAHGYIVIVPQFGVSFRLQGRCDCPGQPKPRLCQIVFSRR
mmetsp:Transcript_47714/g.120948  ORF Transcript_47714/g.120948 Transcript_47714/m.120948 type:complete len:251 (-) Transcript_47714:130-882(-)